MGNFNVSIQVPPLPGLKQYTIDEVQVTITSMGMDTSSWKIDLIGPGSGDVILKHITVNGGDLDGTFSDTPCVGCVLPFQALSAFKGKSALGNWTLAIKATDSSRHGFVSWVSLSLRMNC
jgi:subtilisin-like proprotein convertase family protein